MPEYSFCESVHASSRSPWHIRRLTNVGKRCGGGIDTPSLCGRVKPPPDSNGWDIGAPDVGTWIFQSARICPDCRDVWQAAEAAGKEK